MHKVNGSPTKSAAPQLRAPSMQPPHSFVPTLLCAALLALLCLGSGPARGAEAAGKPQVVNALLFADTTTGQQLLELAGRLRQAGAAPLATFPNQGMLIQLDPALAAAIRAVPGVRLLTFAPASAADAAIAGGDTGAQTAAQIWNQQLAEQAQAASSANAPATPPLPDNDIHFAPRPQLPAAPVGSALPGIYQTSEFMLYNVNVDIFLVESDTSSASNNENWTETAIAKVQAEITTGLTWWIAAATQNDRPSANLTFNFDFHTPFNEPAIVKTSYEPIKLKHSQQDLWINQIYKNLGYTSDWYTNAFNYNHARRAANSTDWSVTIFVANSINDTDGEFADGYFGYAYLNGPIMVITYDNDGWGIDRMDMVVAHENSHLFGGLDEYAASGCTPSETGGYLGVANTNCENGTATETSIMRSSDNQLIAYPDHAVSIPVRGMVGWRDSDGDQLYDPIDTIPSLTLNNSGTTIYFTGANYTLAGSASDPAYPTPQRNLADINDLHAVQYRLNSGAWTACSAVDGAFDETSESYTCALSGLSEGVFTAEVRAVNRTGNTSAAACPSLTLIRDGTAPTGSISINGSAAATNTITASLALAASDASSGLSQMRFSNDGTIWSPWETYAAAKTWTLTSGEGTKTVSVQFKDKAANISASFSDTIVLDTTAPAGTLSINSGASYTNTTAATLALSASDAGSGVAQVRFSNDNTSWSDWAAYTASKAWSLAAGDGSKTVYVQVRDGAGNPSAIASDTITLDATAPTGTASINNGAPYTTTAAVTLALAASDNGSGLAQVRFSNDNTSWSTWQPYATSADWTLASGDGSQTVYIQFSDHAGNLSDPASASILLDTTPPQVSIDSIFLSIEHVMLASWSGFDAGSGLTGYDVQFRIGIDGAWVDWLTATTQTTTSFGPQVPGSSELLTHDTPVFLRVRAHDAAGFTSAYVEKSTGQAVYSLFLPVAIR